MGNMAYGELPNTTAILTDSQSIANNSSQDPGMPKATDGKTVIEVPGQANMEIQRYIIANSKDGAGYIPGSSPYVASNAGLSKPATTNTPSPSTAAATASCANGDVACKSGVSVQQNAPLTPAQQKAAGEFFGQAGTDYQRAAALATAAGNAPVAVSFEIAAGVAGLLEQAFAPSGGKVLIDSLILDEAAKAIATRLGVPIVLVNEVVERDIKPRLQGARDAVDRAIGIAK